MIYRMDGTTEEALLWRIAALREALNDIRSCADVTACREIATNATGVDAYNARIMAHKLSRTRRLRVMEKGEPK